MIIFGIIIYLITFIPYIPYIIYLIIIILYSFIMTQIKYLKKYIKNKCFLSKKDKQKIYPYII